MIDHISERSESITLHIMASFFLFISLFVLLSKREKEGITSTHVIYVMAPSLGMHPIAVLHSVFKDT